MVSKDVVPAVTLNSGYRMPAMGLGVWRMENTAVRGVIHSAIRSGYRHFDCAAKYQNEAEVGEALAEAFQTGLVKREIYSLQQRIILNTLYMSQLPSSSSGIGKTASVIGEDGVLDIDTTISLETTWRAMEKLVYMGLVRSIGISNYGVFLTRDCLAYAKIKPAVNQIEMHPYFQRDSLVKFCQKHGICVTAHTPLGGGCTANAKLFGSLSCLDDPVIEDMAEKYGKTPAQLILRWSHQRNIVVIPKTSKVERLKENIEIFDFDISDEDMEEIKAIDKNHRTNQPGKFWGIDVYA
ncbi:hypothetical protein PR202_ga06314 [Eleusine coracana subsp. coracana]|uniref:NADP-dependent oxidoreductase domain-containing protein n=1 Tax=Eleusine coracana subsp. coracana TaxID=191504 RepID=A0AAV5BY56_ELECO|nr:hypothetical protein PR202_ga06314 [Eleusine coracana subsp. coracana]